MTSHELPTKANDLVTEARLFANLALPSVIIQLGEFLIWTENAMYIGQTQGSTALAAISLANLCGNMSALVLLFGMLSGMDTLAPQEYGAGRKRQVGLLAQRATLVCTGIYPFVALVWFQMPWILYQLGQPEDVNVMASAYLRIYIWALPPMVLFDIARRFLAVQNIVRPFVWIMILVPLVVHPIFLWTFVTYCQMGMNGTAVAVTCSFTFAGGVTALHLKYNRPKRPSATWKFFFDDVMDVETWGGFSMAEAMESKAMWEYLRLSLSGLLSMTEWWYWEILAFLAGRLGTVSLATHSIAYNVTPLCFMVPMGLSIGTSIRVGTLLGEGNAKRAWLVAKCSNCIGLVAVCTTAFLVYCFRDGIVRQFTTDPEVVALAEQMWPLLCFYLVWDNFYGVQRGILIGLGQQFYMGVATVITLGAGLPVLIHVAFTRHQGLVGMWQVMPFIYFAYNCALAPRYIFLDWEKVSRDIQDKDTTGVAAVSRRVQDSGAKQKLKLRHSDPFPPPSSGVVGL
eukprot:m.289886 g.289886  ORF g.289886 m.289886 type:complete len:512 (+) comp19973_c0_seq1:196-1731(+)